MTPISKATGMPNTLDRLERAADFERKGDFPRARQECQDALDAGCDGAHRVEALLRLSTIHRHLCDWDAAVRCARESAQQARACQMPEALGEALNAEAAVYQARGDFTAASPLLQEILTVTDDCRLRGIALQNLGAISAQNGDLGSAERYFAESYGAFMKCGFRRGEAFALNNYGRAALDRGNLPLAADVLNKAIQIAEQIEDGEMIALSSLNLADTMMRQGKSARAEDLASSALGYFKTVGNRWREIECLRLLGELNAGAGASPAARRCWEDGLRIANEIGAKLEARALELRLAALK